MSKPHPGRLRLEITAKYKGEIVFHKAGPANIVMGLYVQWVAASPIWECVRRHAEPQQQT